MGNERLDPKDAGLDNASLSPHFDKFEMKAKFRQRLVQMRDAYLNSADDASFMAREADGPMQSRHDTTKTEQAWLANALWGMGENVDRILSDWEKTFPNETSDKVELGSLIFLEDLVYGDKEWFYMMPFGGGMLIEVEGEKIKGLNIESILGNNLLGKEKGQKIEYKAHPEDSDLQRFKILDVL